MELVWHERAFAELSLAELHAIVMLRERVFVVEQRCVYLEVDGHDPKARHLWATRGDAIVAYARTFAAGVKYPEANIGRVLTAPDARGTGLGRELMRRAIASVGRGAIRVDAQAHLERFYAELGFAPVSEIYLEDGIPHLAMVRPAG